MASIVLGLYCVAHLKAYGVLVWCDGAGVNLISCRKELLCMPHVTASGGSPLVHDHIMNHPDHQESCMSCKSCG